MYIFCLYLTETLAPIIRSYVCSNTLDNVSNMLNPTWHQNKLFDWATLPYGRYPVENNVADIVLGAAQLKLNSH